MISPMRQINTHLYRAQQVRDMDNMAIHECGIPGIVLMERAGAAAFELLRQQWSLAKRIIVFCGSGNNGGDGYVIARLAREQGLSVSVYQVGDHSRLKGEALLAAQALSKTDVVPEPWQAGLNVDADVLVDALLGTGLSGEVSTHYRQAIEAINASDVPVLAVDIPSGLHADTGAVLGEAVKADHSISFIAMKQGLYTGAAADYVGELHFADLDVPDEVVQHFKASATSICFESLISNLRARPRTAHKGQFGYVLIMGGDLGYSGAIRMAGEAALRAGAGRVGLATRAEHAAVMNIGRPELMVYGIEQVTELPALIEKADVVAIGPGLGQSDWGQQLFDHVMESQCPLVVDADGLNLLAQKPQRKDNWVLTPHPGEAGRLLGISAREINADRFAAAEQIQQQYGGTVVLKGAGSLVYTREGLMTVCTDGNPGMASGGMGDVLTGIIASLWAQGQSQDMAAQLGVCLHGAAADLAAEVDGERGLLASDLLPWIRQRVNP